MKVRGLSLCQRPCGLPAEISKCFFFLNLFHHFKKVLFKWSLKLLNIKTKNVSYLIKTIFIQMFWYWFKKAWDQSCKMSICVNVWHGPKKHLLHCKCRIIFCLASESQSALASKYWHQNSHTLLSSGVCPLPLCLVSWQPPSCLSESWSPISSSVHLVILDHIL